MPDLAGLRTAGMTIGKNVSAMNGVHLDPARPWLLSIGDDVCFSLGVVVLTHDASTILHTGYTRLAPVSIGSRVFVGAHAIILPGVTIGDDVVIGAGSVVSRDVPADSVVAGSPARRIATLSEWVEKEKELIRTRPRWSPRELPLGLASTDRPADSDAETLRRSGPGYVGHEKLTEQRDAMQKVIADQTAPVSGV